jgi:flagellar protein FlaF
MMLNAAKMAETAYGAQSAATRTPRGIEYAIFSRVTHRIKAAAEKGASGFPALADALHQNRRLWTILMSDVASDGNGLPRDVRARLFYLGEFTLHHTSKVLDGEADPGALLEINTAVMQGLSGGGGRA